MTHRSLQVKVLTSPVVVLVALWLLSGVVMAECGRWMQTNGPFGGNVISLAIDPVTPSTMYAGTRNGLYRSTDGGANWTALDRALSGTSISILAIDPDTPATLYAGTGKGVFKGTDSGSHWRQLGIAVGSVIHAVAVDPATPSTVYVGTTTSGVWRSTDRGMNWTHVYSGLTELTVYALVVDPSNRSTIYAGTYEGGVFRSTDRGEHWEPTNEGLANLSVLAIAIDPETPTTLYAGTSRHGLYRSLDGGSHWIKMDGGLGSPTIEATAIDPATSSTLYVATAADGVFRSSDRGMQWTSIEAGLPVDATYALAIDPLDPSTLYDGTDDGKVFRSTDGGEHWDDASTGLPPGIDALGLVIDPVTPSTLYLAARSQGVYCTTDGGDHWTFCWPSSSTKPFYATLTIDPPSTPSAVYFGSELGVFRTTDGGAHWSDVSSGPASLTVQYLAMDPETSSGLYAGTDRGVFRFEPSCTASFAQFGDGQGLASDVVLTNPSATETVSGTLSFTDDDGEPLDVGVTTPGQPGNPIPLNLQPSGGAEFSIPAQGTVTFSREGTGELAVGSAEVRSDGTVGGVVRFSVRCRHCGSRRESAVARFPDSGATDGGRDQYGHRAGEYRGLPDNGESDAPRRRRQSGSGRDGHHSRSAGSRSCRPVPRGALPGRGHARVRGHDLGHGRRRDGGGDGPGARPKPGRVHHAAGDAVGVLETHNGFAGCSQILFSRERTREPRQSLDAGVCPGALSAR